jgi:glycosyltransferase involved in cell wall biosynthesis
MKIAIIGSRGYPYVYGGFETFVKELSERLVKKDVEVHIYCQKSLFKDKPKQINGITLHYIPTIQSKSLNQLVHCFLSTVHATFSSFDVLLVVNLAAGPMGWIPKLTGKKTMINVDGLEWLRPKWKGLGAKYFKWAAGLATKFYDVIITDAEAMRQVYLQEFKTESTVIAYGAPPFKRSDKSLIENFDLKHGEYYLIVGRLIPDNNAELIIKGFLKSNSTKKLIVVGDVPYADQYASNLKKLQNERLIFLGYVRNQDELMALYQNAFVYLHGHKFGGTNPAMLKAMSNYCAILALNTVFNQEMLNNGEFGLFFDESESSVAERMEYLESHLDLIKAMQEKVGSGLTDKYSWDHITNSYLSSMKALVSKTQN